MHLRSFFASRFAFTAFFAALIVLASQGICFAIDNGITGLWRTTISRPNGDIVVEWKIENTGNYTVTSFGPGGKQSENGRISTEGNRYMKTTAIGPDNGTFQVIGPNKFSTNGRFGYTEWTRKGAGAAPFGNAYQANLQKPAPAIDQTGGYNPDLNPRSKTWEKMGFGKAGTTTDQSGWKPNTGPAANSNLQGANLKSLLFSNFPLKGGQDEAEQFGLPALGKAAAGGMRKRDFRLIQ